MAVELTWRRVHGGVERETSRRGKNCGETSAQVKVEEKSHCKTLVSAFVEEGKALV
jgi:hypothetical protein